MDGKQKRVVIIGGGFGGIAAAKALARADVQVVLFDRRNHHVFQPLLYQVATASLSPSEISASIRSIVRDIPNCRVVLAEIEGINPTNKEVTVGGESIGYDYLILAAGATNSYFGHDEWVQLAPGLKT
ncbi:MAG: FAD-dependent oxidoreductase, partial [Phycisphaerales bacterium]